MGPGGPQPSEGSDGISFLQLAHQHLNLPCNLHTSAIAHRQIWARGISQKTVMGIATTLSAHDLSAVQDCQRCVQSITGQVCCRE